MQRSESIHELAAALAKAQAKIEGASKDKVNPHLKSRYADMASVVDACRPALTANGLAVIQAPRYIDKLVEVETILVHATGQWVSETLALPVAKVDAQGIGSAITYARRYGLMAIVGIAPEEDDGHAAVQPPAQSQSPASRQAAPSQPPAKPSPIREDVLSFLRHKAESQGLAAMREAWKGLSPDEQKLPSKQDLEDLATVARQTDERMTQPEPDEPQDDDPTF
jgi:hypothetical protein